MPPVSRVVSVNGLAYFKCDTNAMRAYWNIDDVEYDPDMTNERFVIHPNSYNFTGTKHEFNISLTMYGLLQNDNTTIKCIASGHRSASTVRTATLTVLEGI